MDAGLEASGKEREGSTGMRKEEGETREAVESTGEVEARDCYCCLQGEAGRSAEIG